jgi:hypothetical protein
MPPTPRSPVILATLLLACARHEQPHPTSATSSSGLPTLSTADAGAQPPPDAPAAGGADAAAAPATDAGEDAPRSPDVAADLPVLTPDAAADRTPADAPLCSATRATAKPLPVDILVLLDRSGSMTFGVPGLFADGGFLAVSRWDSMKQALSNFVTSPAAAGLEVGLAVFPAVGFDECSVTDYAKPVVAIDALPGVANTFIAAMNATFPDGATPTLPAMQGAIEYARQRETTLGRRTAIALATDGEPNDCNSSVQTVSQAASMAAADGIFTFVIGVGSSMQSFSTIAMAGGTQTAYNVEHATPDELAMAFKGIQMQAARLACTFMVPPPPPGEMLDPFKVNVTFTPTANPGQSFGISIVPGRNDCGPMGGWYFDDLTAPTKLTLCDASCQKVNGAGEGALSLLFGCVAK